MPALDQTHFHACSPLFLPWIQPLCFNLPDSPSAFSQILRKFPRSWKTSEPCFQPLDRTFLRCWRLPWEHSWSWILGIPLSLVSPTLWNIGHKARAGQDLWMGDCLQVGRRQQWGGGQQEITKLPTESRLTSGNLADFPYEVSAILSLDSSLSRFQRDSFLNPLRLIHSPDPLNQTDSLNDE